MQHWLGVCLQIQEYGATLQTRDVVCVVAVLYSTLVSTYDGYTLASMAPTHHCNISDAAFTTLEAKAAATKATAVLLTMVSVSDVMQLVVGLNSELRVHAPRRNRTVPD